MCCWNFLSDFIFNIHGILWQRLFSTVLRIFQERKIMYIYMCACVKSSFYKISCLWFLLSFSYKMVPYSLHHETSLCHLHSHSLISSFYPTHILLTSIICHTSSDILSLAYFFSAALLKTSKPFLPNILMWCYISPLSAFSFPPSNNYTSCRTAWTTLRKDNFDPVVYREILI